MGHDTLDFTVTIHVPQNAVTTAGESIILLLERLLLLEEALGQIVFGEADQPLRNFRGTMLMELAHRADTQGVHHGTKVEVGGIDIIWDDKEYEHAPSCACNRCRGRVE